MQRENNGCKQATADRSRSEKHARKQDTPAVCACGDAAFAQAKDGAAALAVTQQHTPMRMEQTNGYRIGQPGLANKPA